MIKNTEFQINEEIYFIIDSLEENSQNAIVYLQNSSLEINLNYDITINKGLEYLSLGTNLPEGKYRLILSNEKGGYSVNFKVVTNKK